MIEVPFARPWFGGGEAEAVAEVIESGWLTQGPVVERFERAVADRLGVAEAVATTSCSTALQLALTVAGIGPGDEVILPSLTFIATANAVSHCGATPVFADVDPATLNVDPADVERRVGPRTRALLPVHQLGLPADMDALLGIAQEHGLELIEDAACAIGALHRGRPIGSLGPLACFSFHPRKVITCGEGGMIAVGDPEQAERLRRLRQQGMDLSALSRHRSRQVLVEHYPERGWNARMTDLQAAVGLRQLAVLDEVLAERRRLAVRYARALAGVPGLELPGDPEYAVRAWQSYAVRIDPGVAEVPALMRALLADGIATRRGVMAIHLERAYRGLGSDLPETGPASAETLMLPLFCGLSDREQDYVVERIGAHLPAAVA